MSVPPFQPELLLAHADFVRRLAASLVGDASRADDVAQEVALGALRRPPRDLTGLRGWLAASARSIARNLWRAEQREKARVAARVEEASAPSPHEVLAREEVRQRVVHAVLALEEPFRATVLLRFYDDLSPRAIAARLGVPPATVRTRLKRGLDRLRERLGADADPRAGGLLLLCPGRRAGFLVWCAMNMKLVGLGGAAAAALVLAWWLAWRAPVAAPPVVGEKVVVPAGSAPAAASEEPPQRTAADAPERGGEAELPVFPADRPLGRLEGIVLDLEHARVAGASVELKPWIGVMPAERRIRDDRTRTFTARTESGGTFTCVDVPEGPYVLTASAKGLSKRELVAVGPSAMGPTVVMLETPATFGDDVRVQVYDADRTPVANATVTLHGISAREGPIGFADTEPLRGKTDHEGSWRMRGRSVGDGVLLATTADGRVGAERISTSSDPKTVRVVVGAPARVRGRFVGVQPHVAQGVILSAHLRGADGPVVSASIEGDAFSFDGLPPGEHALALRGPAGLRLVTTAAQDQNREGLLGGPTVSVVEGATVEIQLAVTQGSAVSGTVTCAGAPVPNARVQVRPATNEERKHGAVRWSSVFPWRHLSFSPHYVAHTVTDGRGRYALASLTPGPHVVEVIAPGLGVDPRVPVELKDGVTVDLAHALRRAGALQLAGSKGTLAVTLRGQTKPLLIVGAWDCVTVPALAAGEYALSRESGRFGSGEFRTLREFTIEAGRTTWLDLRDAVRQASIRGVVRAGARPLPGVVVSQGDARAVTDADGNYALRHTDPSRIWGGEYESPLAVFHGGLRHQVWLTRDASGPAAANLDVQLGEHGLVVDVVDARGQPCAAEVTVRASSSALEVGATQNVYGTVRVGAGDRARLTPLRPGQAWIEATFASGVVDDVKVDVPAAGPLRVQDRPCGTLRVRASVGGDPAAECGITVRTWRGAGPAPSGEEDFTDAWYRDVRSDRDGETVLRGVVAGEVCMRVHGPGRSTQVLRFTLAPGETKDLQVDLPR